MKRLIAVVALSLAGCATLNSTEQMQFANLQAQGAPDIEHEKSMTAAALLNVLPGFGDIYNGEWGAFALDFLLWVPSVVWAVPQGAVTARNINRRAYLTHYLVGPGSGGQFDPNRYTVPRAGAPE